MRWGTTLLTLLTILAGAAFVAPTAPSAAESPTWAANPPAQFIPPPLHPKGAKLRTQQLAPGVYALLSDHLAIDNSGFVVGERGVLVIDAHINRTMARQIQSAVRAVTDKPILYLVNTNYHGDHTFGNDAFPPETTIVAHRETAAHMPNFESEKEQMLRTVGGDQSVFGDATLRLPDVTFDTTMTIDLGGRVVQLHHFGHGNTPGDTVVYVPETRTAWTGNLVVGEGTIPPIFESNPREYMATVARFAETLEAETIIPGHGTPTTGRALGRYLHYFSDLIQVVRHAVRSGWTAEQAVSELTLPAPYAPPVGHPAHAFLVGLHALNVQQAYLELTDH